MYDSKDEEMSEWLKEHAWKAKRVRLYQATPKQLFLRTEQRFGLYRRTRIGQRVDDNQAAGLTANA